MVKQYIAINWNAIEDEVDKATWEKLTKSSGLYPRPLFNDLDDWRSFSPHEQWVVGHVFGGFTLPDTLQSQDGMASLRQNSSGPNRKPRCLIIFSLWKSVHAKSYSSIFSTLNTPAEIDEIFDWTNHNGICSTRPTKSMTSITTARHYKRKLPVFSWKRSCFISGFFTCFITWVTTS